MEISHEQATTAQVTTTSGSPTNNVPRLKKEDTDTATNMVSPTSPLTPNLVRLPVWYCPARWLMAHHDPNANIYTMSSHMCLADLNNEGENLLALVDFKQRISSQDPQQQNQPGLSQAPYNCRLRVYRGQQLIYNHFLDDMPSCLIATSMRSQLNQSENISSTMKATDNRRPDIGGTNKPLLTLTINDDVYFYHKLKPSHKLSLEDEDCIVESLNKSEYEAWQMVRENKVDVETMRELLISLSNELGPNELTSHSNNFLSLNSNNERKNYLLLWKFKRLNNGVSEHMMSMDTICCAAARLQFTSDLTRSGDFGQTRETGTFLNNLRWNKILDIQKEGLVVGTEDKHVLIYELRSTRAYLEAHYRLQSTPDHILVERKSPSNFDFKMDLKSLTYRILVSCRNCRIYSIDQHYLIDRKAIKKSQMKELIALKCNVLDMSWTGDEAVLVGGVSQPDFVVACLDRRVYCFSSHSGVCKWLVEAESPITCLISLPTCRSMGTNDSCLVGVASKANRIDFYVSLTGRIVDSIYFCNDYCQAMTFGRFGREDNCLCLTTNLGHLLILILKRTAKFANAQCLSSAASFASAIMSNWSEKFRQEAPSSDGRESAGLLSKEKLAQAPGLPSAFKLTKSSIGNQIEQAIDPLQVDHCCDQQIPKSVLDAYLSSPQLQVPVKSRDFVDHAVEQSRHSTGKFAIIIVHSTTDSRRKVYLSLCLLVEKTCFKNSIQFISFQKEGKKFFPKDSIVRDEQKMRFFCESGSNWITSSLLLLLHFCDMRPFSYLTQVELLCLLHNTQNINFPLLFVVNY